MMLQSVGGGFVVQDDVLRFYFGASNRGPPSPSLLSPPPASLPPFAPPAPPKVPDFGSTGSGTLRRDGFASISYPASARTASNGQRSESSTAGTGTGTSDTFSNLPTVTTYPLAWSSPTTLSTFFVNVNGSVAVEVLDTETLDVIEPFSAANCIIVSSGSGGGGGGGGSSRSTVTAVDSTRAEVRWTGATAGLAPLEKVGSVRFRFILRAPGTELYSFWVSGGSSTTLHAPSRGYVAAGGPSYATHRDV